APSASTTRCSGCCSTRRRRSSSTPSLGCSSSPAVSSSSKGYCTRWSRTRRSCTRLGATSPKPCLGCYCSADKA
ncbi:unnamed protein product, partial [Musa acuminata var. zebrina]